jgi:dTDP-4-amino-4,6-dideoxygalactose transaminase
MKAGEGVKILKAVCIDPIIALRNVVLNRPLKVPPFRSMTLDKDDVDIARRWLNDPSRWDDRKVVQDYESGFARWNGSRYAFGFMGGSVALGAILHSLGLQRGDEVIVPAYTCVTVPKALELAGLKTVFCDIELDTYGLDASRIPDSVGPGTRAVLLQHLYGLVCRDYEAILDIAGKYGLKVIEDCAQATGAEYKGVKVGNLGDAAFYSSDRSKVFNTVMGGVASTNDDLVAGKMKEHYERTDLPDRDWVGRMLFSVIHDYYTYKHPYNRLTGVFASRLYEGRVISEMTDEEGFSANYGLRMPAPIAALGLNQVAKIEMYNEKRRRTAGIWDRWCDNNGYKRPFVLDGSLPVFLRYPVMVEPEKIKDVSWALGEMKVSPGNVFCRRVYPNGLVRSCPNAEAAIDGCINLPTLF